MSIRITPTDSVLGARIEGVDLRKPLDDPTFAEVRRAFYEYEVVYFRGVELSDEDHIRFSARFGELRKLKLDELHAQYPEIFVVSNIKDNGKYTARAQQGRCANGGLSVSGSGPPRRPHAPT